MADRGKQVSAIGDLLRRGLALHNAGDLDGAEQLYRQILELDIRFPDAHHLLGVVELFRKHHDAAIRHIDIAIGIDPSQAIYFNNLGNCYLGRHEMAVSEMCFRQAVTLDDNYADGWNSLGWVLCERKRYAESYTALERVLALAPQHERALCNMASLKLEFRYYDEALEQYEQALAINPGSARARQGKMNCLFELGRYDEAFEIADRIAATDPSVAADAIARKGHMLEQLGRTDEAIAMLDQSLELDPENPRLLYARSRSSKVRAGDTLSGLLRQAEPKLATEEGNNKVQLAYALGKGAEDAGDIAEAARFYAVGAAARRLMQPYDEPEEDRFLANLIDSCTPDYLAGLAAQGIGSDRPIFVLGMMRSGTTLVEQILVSHPDVFAGGELGYIPEALQSFVLPGGMVDPTRQGPVLPAASFHDRAAHYLEQVAKLESAPVKPRFTDKLPANFWYLGLIHALFPNARIIHCRRDPVDTCISNYTMLYRQPQPWTYELGAMGRYYRRYWALMEHWRQVAPGAFLEIRYEDMVADQPGMTRRMLDWCGLPWNDQVLKFYETQRIVGTASLNQVRQPIYTSSMGRWKKWEPYIRPLLDEVAGIEAEYWATP